MGFFIFIQTVLNLPVVPASRVDLIVVLTGGEERIHAGLQMLARGHGKKLLITGVHNHVSLENILAQQNETFPSLKKSIILGKKAVDTQSNAIEAADWVKKTKAHSLLLITANYHMPRSLLIFNHYLPHTNISTHPVNPRSVHQNNWVTWPGTMGLLFLEYNKYLVSLIWIGLLRL